MMAIAFLDVAMALLCCSCENYTGEVIMVWRWFVLSSIVYAAPAIASGPKNPVVF